MEEVFMRRALELARTASLPFGSVIVKDGKPIEQRMRMVNVDLQDVLEAARHGPGLRHVDEIAYAVLERNGEISVIPKDRK